MPRPKVVEDRIIVSVGLPKELVDWIDQNYPNRSEFLREAAEEKAAREAEFAKKKLIHEIEILKAELEKKQSILNSLKHEEVEREEEEKAHLISILKAVFEGMGFDSIPSLNIRDNLRYGTDRDRLREWVQKRLEKISEATGADVEELRKLAFEHVEGFKEVMSDVLD